MDELTNYLQSQNHYYKFDLEQILDTKIMINKDHILCITGYCLFNIIKLFEQYGYVFTNDDYIFLAHNPSIFVYIPDNKRTYEICKLAVQYDAYALQYITEDKKTDEICKIAVQQCGLTLKFVPEYMRTNEIYKIAVEQNRLTLYYISDDKKCLFMKN